MYCYPRLRDLREDADLTQKEIGALLNTTQQQYAKYEQGVQEIPTHHLIVLADFYNVSVDFILGRMEWDDMRMLQQLEKLPQKQKKQVFYVLKDSGEK